MTAPKPPDDRELFYWLALFMAPGVGAVRFARLVDHFKSPEAVFSASAKALSAVGGLPKRTVEAIGRFEHQGRVEAELSRVKKHGCQLVTLNDSRYPRRLAQVKSPPPILWTNGELIGDEVAVAVVGSRSAGEYGLAASRRIAAELAAAGVCVVSGVALGVDAAAHHGALDAGGRTVGVLGCGLDVVYPRPNRDLYRLIPQSGALISEFQLGVRPDAGHFPSRNRIIAGMSMAVVVVEAAEKSGALITARLGLEENREVFAVPGHAGGRNRGGHNLLRQGALLAESAMDIIREIAPQLVEGAPAPKAQPPPRLEGEHKKIWLALDGGPVHVDVISRKTGLTTMQLAPILLDMELKGLVKLLPGMQYTRLIS